ncbi:MAG: putative DNA binding domain-containing protein [Prevotellaceae bacterium]|jgi:ATP-dependent DNA helicase RecG|nr:putative DNA binding domain-containing protein [Prevotellaceae bacterium]
MKKESQYIAFKENWRDEFLKILSAFANTAGGHLYVGIRDDGSVCGISKTTKLLEDLPNKITNILGIQANVYERKKNNLKYIEIKIDKSPYPVSYNGGFYIRSGSITRELTGNTLQHFLLTANNMTWDEIPVPDASWDEIDEDTVRLFINKAEQTNRLPPNIKEDNIKDLFERLSLSKNGVLTRAAVLLFSKIPTRYFMLAVCKIGRFLGNSHTNLKMDDLIECPLFRMPDRIMEILESRYIQTEFTYKGLQRIPVWEYPETALREAIMNAIIHRDYGGNTFFIIKVFDNNMEIWNEGELMEPLDIKSLKKQHLSRLRNKLIANVFYRSGYIESWGRGTLKMLEDAQAGEYKEPEFENFEGGILVRFERKLLKEEIAETKQQILDSTKIKYADDILKLIKEHPTITNKEMAQKLTMSDRNIRRILIELIDAKIIVRIGSKRSGNWVIIDDVIEMSLQNGSNDK